MSAIALSPDWGAQAAGVALGAGVLERVTRHTSALVQHGDPGVGAGFEQRQRHMASWQFIVAPAAGIRRVTRRALGAFQCCELAVYVVLPAGRVRSGLHYQMA